MTAVFLRKKQWWYLALCQFVAGVIIICLAYALMLNYANSVWIGKSFYFLVTENAHIDASTHEIRLDGGAGYLLEYEGSTYVAWAVYFNEEDGDSVQAGLTSPTRLLKFDVSYLSFKTRNTKKKKDVIKDALNSFYGCIDVLGQVIERLDQGLTQQACGRILNTLKREYVYMYNAYQEAYPQFSQACKNMQSAIECILSKTIYGKDLRYLLCSACDAYIRLASVFTL